MAFRFYDESLVKKIQGWVKDPNMTITGPDETRRLFDYIADTTDDEPIQLPLITIRRLPDIELNNTNKQPLSFDASTIKANCNEAMLLNVIGATLHYQLDIYTRYFAECDEYVRNFIFNIVNYPTLLVTLPYNDIDEQHESNIRLASNVRDNSDIPERLVPGQFTRFTLNLDIDDAYIFSAPIRDTWSIESEVDVELQADIKLSTEIDSKLGDIKCHKSK